jgi:hypothetical protein
MIAILIIGGTFVVEAILFAILVKYGYAPKRKRRGFRSDKTNVKM